MEIGLGMPVRTTDDQNAGVIDRLVIDPLNGKVTAVVLQKGAFLPHDIAVPIALLEPLISGEARILCAEAELNSFEAFSLANYTTPPDDYAPTSGYAPGSFPSPDDYNAALPAADRANRAKLSRHGLDGALIGTGSMVRDTDGKNVGEVHQLNLDTVTGDLTSLIVRHGFLFAKDEELPVSLIAQVADGVIYIKVAAEGVFEASATG